MDPEATLKKLESAVTKRYYTMAVEALNDYYQWRVKGGFEPRNGDSRADMAANELADCLEAFS